MISHENAWRYLCCCRVICNFSRKNWAKCWRIWCFDQRKSRMSEKDADRVPKFLPNEVKKDPPPLGEIYNNISCFIRLLIGHEQFDVLKQNRFWRSSDYEFMRSFFQISQAFCSNFPHSLIETQTTQNSFTSICRTTKICVCSQILFSYFFRILTTIDIRCIWIRQRVSMLDAVTLIGHPFLSSAWLGLDLITCTKKMCSK